MTPCISTECLEVHPSLNITSGLDDMDTVYVPCMNKEMWSSFQNNGQQMKKRLKIICILLPACIEKESVCFQDLPGVPEREVFLPGVTVRVKDRPVVGVAPKFSVCANWVPFPCVAENERDLQVRGTCTDVALDPGPSLR